MSHTWTPAWADGDPDTGWDTTTPGEWAPETAPADTPQHTPAGDQVRSRQRVRDLAEVFTHTREVNAMLDLMPDAFTHLDVKFLEPACGSGNFLVAILRRKLNLVSARQAASQEHYEHRLLRAAASIYGIDISLDNVAEARARCGGVLLEHYQADANTTRPTAGFLSCAAAILTANIVVGDTLNAADQVELLDWQPKPGGFFQRVSSFALVPEADRDLFWVETTIDRDPIHYSHISEDAGLVASLLGEVAQ